MLDYGNADNQLNKLSKRIQKKLLEFFVLKVTDRSAADILGIQFNSAIF